MRQRLRDRNICWKDRQTPRHLITSKKNLTPHDPECTARSYFPLQLWFEFSALRALSTTPGRSISCTVILNIGWNKGWQGLMVVMATADSQCLIVVLCSLGTPIPLNVTVDVYFTADWPAVFCAEMVDNMTDT